MIVHLSYRAISLLWIIFRWSYDPICFKEKDSIFQLKMYFLILKKEMKSGGYGATATCVSAERCNQAYLIAQQRTASVLRRSTIIYFETSMMLIFASSPDATFFSENDAEILLCKINTSYWRKEKVIWSWKRSVLWGLNTVIQLRSTLHTVLLVSWATQQKYPTMHVQWHILHGYAMPSVFRKSGISIYFINEGDSVIPKKVADI